MKRQYKTQSVVFFIEKLMQEGDMFVIYFLSSEKSSYINGEIVTIDGGYC